MVDVRDSVQYDICSFQANGQHMLVVNIPFSKLESNLTRVTGMQTEVAQSNNLISVPIYFVCRLGNDSQRAVKLFANKGIITKDLIGGYRMWSNEISDEFPVY
jgi:adenylyltransferase and sulfurtransferase